MSRKLCLEPDPRVGLRLTRPTEKNPGGRIVRGVPRCRRLIHLGGWHRGEGWIWNETTSWGDHGFNRAHAAVVGTEDAI